MSDEIRSSRRVRLVVLLLMIVAGVAGCGRSEPSPLVPARPASTWTAAPADSSVVQSGYIGSGFKTDTARQPPTDPF